MNFVIEISKIDKIKSLKEYQGIDEKNYYLLNNKLINLYQSFYDQFISIQDQSEKTQDSVTLHILSYKQMIDKFNQIVDRVENLELELKQKKQDSKIMQQELLKTTSLIDSYMFKAGEIQDYSDQSPIKQLMQQQNKSQIKSKIKFTQVINTINESNLCQFCYQILEENNIQTTCQCKFHFYCFEDMLKKQLQMGESKLICKCQKKLEQNAINLIDNLLVKKILYNKLFENQYQALKLQQKFDQHYFLDCEQCDFFILYPNPNGQSYCPICYNITTFKQQ